MGVAKIRNMLRMYLKYRICCDCSYNTEHVLYVAKLRLVCGSQNRYNVYNEVNDCYPAFLHTFTVLVRDIKNVNLLDSITNHNYYETTGVSD